MNREEFRIQFEENVEYLSKIVAPDDIYPFCEQTLMAACFFLKRWNEVENLDQVCKKDPVARNWILNVLNYHQGRMSKEYYKLDLNLEGMFNEDNSSG